MRYRSTEAAGTARRGFVLVAVLVVVVLLTLAAYQFGDLMLAEYKATDSYLRSAQARAFADSGIAYAAALLSNPDAFTNTLNSNPYDNPSVFQGVTVNGRSKAHLRGRFGIFAPLDPGDPSTGSLPFRVGVTDEGGKINLNALMKIDSSGQVLFNMLMALPNVTEDIADPIVDWLDADDNPRQNGAEDTYYQTLSPPYHAKNGPLDSLEELLLVKGITPQVLFGNDRNRNGILDPGEDDGSGQVDRGLSAYFTIYSRELNVDSHGNPRIYINSKDLQQLQQDLTPVLGQPLANYIVLYRLYGAATAPSTTTIKVTPGTSNSGKTSGAGSGASGGSKGGAGGAGGAGASKGGGGSGGGATLSMTLSSSSGDVDDQKASALGGLSTGSMNLKNGKPKPISSLFELVNSYVQVPASKPGAKAQRYPSPLNDPAQQQQLLPLLFDSVSTSKSSELPGRINVNTAPAAVLAALPKLTDNDIQNILSSRPNASSVQAPDPIFQSPAWLISVAHISPKTLQALDKYITTRSQVYRVQSVGTFDRGGPSVRIEAVIDTNLGFPRILYRRELTELGKGFDVRPGGGAP
jgi:type II secretory pathway component PulK